MNIEPKFIPLHLQQSELIFCVYYEVFTTIEEAIAREKQLKRWNRAKKEMLINQINKEWKDLSPEILEW